MKDIVILSGGFESTLAISQIIGKKSSINIYVFYLEGKSYAAIKSSKFVTECYDLTSYNNRDCYLYFKEWYENKKNSDKPILFCTSDRACLLVAHNYAWFNVVCTLTTPNASIIDTYNSKLKTYEATSKIGIKAPKSIIVYKGTNIMNINTNWNFPIIIKPVSAEQISEVGFKVKVVYNKIELEHLYTQKLKKHTVIIQEYIAGEDDKSWFYVFYRKGTKVISECIGKKILQHPSKQGIMAIGLTMENQNIASICHTFLEKIDYQGIGGIEFKECNGVYYFIEMSTRAEGFIKITQSTNPAMLSLIYDSLNNKTPFINTKQTNIGFYYIDPILSLLEIRKNPIIILKLLKAIFSFNFTFSFVDLNDIRPCYTHLINTVKLKISSIIKLKQLRQ